MSLAYQGVPPVASCHWQWIGNILAERGFDGYYEKLGLSWGFRWFGSGPLFGSARWPVILGRATGALIEIRTFENVGAAIVAEESYFSRNVDVVVEVDEFYLTGYEVPDRHVVHAVYIVNRPPKGVCYVDSQIGPVVRFVGSDVYSAMRSSPCTGRVEPYKLYAIVSDPQRDPTPTEWFDAAREDLAIQYAPSLKVAHDYLRAVQADDAEVDVCRAAGERYQAAKFFGFLAAQSFPNAARFQELMSRLSDQWYLLHTLSSHPRAEEPRNRVRLAQMLEAVIAADANTTEVLLD